MNRPNALVLMAGILLLVVALAHLFRIARGWQVTIADASIPMWVSWVAVLVAGILGVMLVRDSRR